MPLAALAQPLRQPMGANRRLLRGRVCCAAYTVKEPLSLMRCARKKRVFPNGTVQLEYRNSEEATGGADVRDESC